MTGLEPGSSGTESNHATTVLQPLPNFLKHYLIRIIIGKPTRENSWLVV